MLGNTCPSHYAPMPFISSPILIHVEDVSRSWSFLSSLSLTICCHLFIYPCSESFSVLLGEWEEMGHDFGVWGGRFSPISNLGASLMISVALHYSSWLGSHFYVTKCIGNINSHFWCLLGPSLSPSRRWGFLGVFHSWFMLFCHCSIPRDLLVCFSVVREPQFPDLWVNGGRICSCYVQKRFLCFDSQFGGLWWSICSHIS